MKCEQKGCESQDALECRIYDYDDQKDIIFHYCSDHAEANGFCRLCGEFWGGIESFEFWHPGFCDNCWDELQADCGECEEEEEPNYFDDGDFLG